ncbi:MAG: DUF3299 domain-containing protein [Bacteroidota bacterium]
MTSTHNIKRIFWVVGIFMLTTLNSTTVFGQTAISWDVLADVTFHEEYDEVLQTYWLIPTFGKQPKSYQNKTIVLEGYFIPIDPESGFYVLSKNPYSSCFFCGAAGPETVVEIQLDEELARHISMDERIKVKGKLALNKSDFDHCNYILKSASTL